MKIDLTDHWQLTRLQTTCKDRALLEIARELLATYVGAEGADRMIDGVWSDYTYERNVNGATEKLYEELDLGLGAIENAGQQLARLTGRDCWDADYAEGRKGSDIEQHLDNARRELQAALLLHASLTPRAKDQKQDDPEQPVWWADGRDAIYNLRQDMWPDGGHYWRWTGGYDDGGIPVMICAGEVPEELADMPIGLSKLAGIMTRPRDAFSPAYVATAALS